MTTGLRDRYGAQENWHFKCQRLGLCNPMTGCSQLPAEVPSSAPHGVLEADASTSLPLYPTNSLWQRGLKCSPSLPLRSRAPHSLDTEEGDVSTRGHMVTYVLLRTQDSTFLRGTRNALLL